MNAGGGWTFIRRNLARKSDAGCDDALVGIGQPGRLALEFTRKSASARAVLRSALTDVKCAIPCARLLEAAP
jgi:hypothetical protein